MVTIADFYGSFNRPDTFLPEDNSPALRQTLPIVGDEPVERISPNDVTPDVGIDTRKLSPAAATDSPRLTHVALGAGAPSVDRVMSDYTADAQGTDELSAVACPPNADETTRVSVGAPIEELLPGPDNGEGGGSSILRPISGRTEASLHPEEGGEALTGTVSDVQHTDNVLAGLAVSGAASAVASSGADRTVDESIRGGHVSGADEGGRTGGTDTSGAGHGSGGGWDVSREESADGEDGSERHFEILIATLQARYVSSLRSNGPDSAMTTLLHERLMIAEAHRRTITDKTDRVANEALEPDPSEVTQGFPIILGSKQVSLADMHQRFSPQLSPGALQWLQSSADSGTRWAYDYGAWNSYIADEAVHFNVPRLEAMMQAARLESLVVTSHFSDPGRFPSLTQVAFSERIGTRVKGDAYSGQHARLFISVGEFGSRVADIVSEERSRDRGTSPRNIRTRAWAMVMNGAIQEGLETAAALNATNQKSGSLPRLPSALFSLKQFQTMIQARSGKYEKQIVVVQEQR